jgi:hypothetical protein
MTWLVWCTYTQRFTLPEEQETHETNNIAAQAVALMSNGSMVGYTVAYSCAHLSSVTC